MQATSRTFKKITGGQSALSCREAKPWLLYQFHEALRSRHYSRRTEQTYCPWVKRFIKTTMIYTHVLNRGPSGVRSPVDGL
jgi:hypothetical protein